MKTSDSTGTTAPGCRFLIGLLLAILPVSTHGHTIRPLADTVGLLDSPAPFFLPAVWYWTGTAALTGGAFFLDRSVRNGFRIKEPGALGPILTAGERFGNGWICFAGAAGCVAGGLLFRSDPVLALGVYLFEAYTLSGTAVLSVKLLCGRSRPYLGSGPFDFHPPGLSSERQSFYSGHTTMAFAGASVISGWFGHPAVSVPVYILAGLTGWQRIAEDKHWLSDVLLGASMGLFIGHSIVSRNRTFAELSADEEGLRISFRLKKF